jgi:hypothetical protein
MLINRAMIMAIERQHNVKFLMANWKQIEISKTVKIRFRNRTKITIWGKWFCLRSFLIGWQAKARARSAGVAGFPHGRATISKEGLGRRGMKVGKIFFEEGCSSELTDGLESWFIEYLNSEMDAGKRWWLEFGQLRGLLKHVHGSTDVHHLKTRIKKIIFMMMIRMMIRMKTMIGTWMTWRSRLAFLSC